MLPGPSLARPHTRTEGGVTLFRASERPDRRRTSQTTSPHRESTWYSQSLVLVADQGPQRTVIVQPLCPRLLRLLSGCPETVTARETATPAFKWKSALIVPPRGPIHPDFLSASQYIADTAPTPSPIWTEDTLPGRTPYPPLAAPPYPPIL